MANKTPEQIAEERIEEARRTGATMLSLADLGLTSLPDSIAWTDLPEAVRAGIAAMVKAAKR